MLSTYLSRTSIRTQIAHVEVWLYTHVHKHLPVDVKVTKFSYFRAAGKYKDMRTGPHHVFDMKVGKNWILLILFILFWIRKDCFIYSEKKTISCSLDPATNSETRKRKIQDFLVLQVFRLDETKNLRQKIQFPSKNQKDLSSLWSITFRRHCISCMQDRALQCDVILIEIMIIKQMLIHHYLSDPHLLFKWSKSLIVGPHLSGFESLGQTVTVGKGNSSMG